MEYLSDGCDLTWLVGWLVLGFIFTTTISTAAGLWNGEPGVVHQPSPLAERKGQGIMVYCGDGSVIMFGGKKAVVSADDGRTWGKPVMLKTTGGAELAHGVRGALKLRSGKIGVVTGRQGIHFFHTSTDGGRTITEPVPIISQGMRVPYYRSQITQLRSGRIVVPFYEFCGRRNYEITWKRAPWSWSSMCYSYVVYSDDEGQTWRQSADDVVIVPAYWTQGQTETFCAFEETTAIELNDNRIIMIGRNRMGRLFQSFSSDAGVHWSIAEPTELAASYAPAEIRRIAKTGDLVICWNQVAKQEIIDGLNRHRLTVAISVDEGKTWGNFKNLYSLDDHNYVQPDPPQIIVPGDQWVQWLKKHGGPANVPGRGSVGTENVSMLPEDRSRYHREPASIRTCYPLMCVTDNHVLIVYEMSQPMPRMVVLDRFPIDWLYDPIVPEGPYADLVIDGKRIENVEISIEDGALFGWGDAMGKALGMQMKRTRVPVRVFLTNHGATVPDDGWRPGEGQRGTLYAKRASLPGIGAEPQDAGQDPDD